MGIEGEANEKELATALDENLSANKAYKSARQKALKGVEVVTIPLNIFYEWNAKNKKKGGQVKMEKVMKADKFATWEQFVKEALNN